jgi:hypothetical protein
VEELCVAVREGAWAGTPNALGPGHVEWPALAAVATATAKPRTAARVLASPKGEPSLARLPALEPFGDASSAVRLIRGRRSAVSMDGATGLTATAFFALLDRLLPHPGVPPWDVLPWPARVHPVLFVHRVHGLAPGVYLLERAGGVHETLREAMRGSFAWERPEACPGGLRLFRLEAGDAGPLARFASCHQEIASDSAFAIAMLADLGRGLDEGAWWYRRLHWETGVLGQALYLGAEAAGRRATGIGCFFDDVVHDTLGLADSRFRNLYHFTLGGAIEDRRLSTRPGYADAVKRRS